MKRNSFAPALIAHGGAGGRPPAAERPARRRYLLEAVERGTQILRDGGSALDAVIATVVTLEDAPYFNAGYGSVLTTEGRIEMDAGIMVAERGPIRSPRAVAGSNAHGCDIKARAGGVVLVSRVRNPITLARAVMEHTPHVLIGAAGAERLARELGIASCRPEQLVSQRARERWLAARQSVQAPAAANPDRHGTVGAVAVDVRGNLAAATSTGGVSGKLPGRIGDSAIIGAGFFANMHGGASATGTGEAILRTALCRETVIMLARRTPKEAAESAITRMYAETGRDAGIIAVNSAGRFGYAHNAQAMEVAMFDPVGGVRHLAVEAMDLGVPRSNHR